MKDRLDHATLTYAAADEETAAAVREIHAQVLAILKANLGFDPRTQVHVRVVRSWLAYLLRGVGWLQAAFSLLALPLLWYWLRFARGWDHAYAAAWIRGARRAAINVKSLRRLPPGLPPNLTTTFSAQPQVVIDRPTLWREEVCRCLVVAYCYWRLPTVLLGGLARFVSRQVVPIPNSEPTDWGQVLRWAGFPPPALDLRKAADLPQAAIDELVARLVWPYGLVRFLEERHPGLLRNLMAMSLPREKVTPRLAADLGLPAEALWSALADQATQYLGGTSLRETADGSTAAASTTSLADRAGRDRVNPYSSPRLDANVPHSAFRRRSGGGWLTLAFLICCVAASLAFGNLLLPLLNWPPILIHLLGALAGALGAQVAYVILRVLLDLSRGK